MRGIELTPEHPPARVADLAATAEAEGFDAVLCSSHYFNRDPFVALDRVAAATDDVLVGPGVVNPYETHPVALASRAATLDEAAGGRAVFGVGAGDRSALAALGVERDRPLRRVLETVEVARRLWAGERVTHDGTFRASDAALNYGPRELPVYVGAQGPDMLRMAGKYGDGVLVNGSHPGDLSWAADRVAEGVAGRPDDAGTPTVLAHVCVSVADDAAAAREAARPAVAFVVGGAAPPALRRHGIDEDDAAAVSDALEAGDIGAATERVTPAMVEAFCAAGTPDRVADRIAAVCEHVDGVVAGSPLGPDLDRAVGLAARALDRTT